MPNVKDFKRGECGKYVDAVKAYLGVATTSDDLLRAVKDFYEEYPDGTNKAYEPTSEEQREYAEKFMAAHPEGLTAV